MAKKMIDPIRDFFVETFESFGTGMKAKISIALSIFSGKLSVSPINVCLI